MVTEQIEGGALGGLVETRDRTINELLDRVNELALTVAENVNDVHRTGFDVYNNTGNEFFDIDADAVDAAETFQIHGRILGDVGRISAAADPRSPADNRIANAIGSLEYTRVMNDGVATMDEFYNSMVGEVGVETKKADNSLKMQADILKQLRNLRESISGVSLDEEATKIIEYQKAFDASARLIRTADEMFDTVLNLKRY